MKRLIIMLLILGNAAAPALAQSKSKAQKKYDLTIMIRSACSVCSETSETSLA